MNSYEGEGWYCWVTEQESDGKWVRIGASARDVTEFLSHRSLSHNSFEAQYELFEEILWERVRDYGLDGSLLLDILSFGQYNHAMPLGDIQDKYVESYIESHLENLQDYEKRWLYLPNGIKFGRVIAYAESEGELRRVYEEALE